MWKPTYSERRILWGVRGEISAYAYSRGSADRINDSITELENRFEAHSPNIGGTPITPTDHDKRLSNYVDMVSRYRDDLKTYDGLAKRVEGIMAQMDHDIAVYEMQYASHSRSMQQIADQAGYSIAGCRAMLDRELLAAVRRYEGQK